MTPVDYLLTSFVAFAAMAAWTLFIAARHAVDGFEDEFGFHLGVAPPITSLYPALGQSVYAPAELLRAVVPALPKRRRKRGTKPPMLPANLNADDLHSGPAINAPANKSENSQSAPGSDQAHNSPSNEQSPGA